MVGEAGSHSCNLNFKAPASGPEPLAHRPHPRLRPAAAKPAPASFCPRAASRTSWLILVEQPFGPPGLDSELEVAPVIHRSRGWQ